MTPPRPITQKPPPPATNTHTQSLNFGYTDCPSGFPSGCTMHSGFKLAWEEISASVISSVNSALASNPSYGVVSTGHSLGGAVAAIGTAHLRRTLSRSIDIYSYGAPRIGNSVFVDYLSSQSGSHFRVTHGSDPVPRLPPAFLGFRHTTPEYWIASNAGDDGVWGSNEISVCTGTVNLSCNGGTVLLDIIAHLTYFQSVGGCFGATRREDDLVISEEALAERLKTLSLLDQEYFKNHSE